MPLSDASYTAVEQDQLLKLAAESIQFGLRHGRRMSVKDSSFPPRLRQETSCFVTLTKGGNLRGCIGSLVAHRPLVEDVVSNAFAAAFEDPRFPPLQESELTDLDISLSILTPSQPMSFTSEQDLLRQIRPYVDGLILSDGYHRGTFLPSVWESLPNAADFLRHLKMKAGLAPNAWSPDIAVERYTTISFHKAMRDIAQQKAGL